MNSVLARYLMRELSVTVGVISLILVLIFFSAYFATLLGKAASGEFPSDLIYRLLLIESSVQFIQLLPAAFFLAALLVFGRMYQDHEMSVLAACGVGPGSLFKRLLPFILGFVLLESVLALGLLPSLIMQGKLIQLHAEQRADVAGISAGRFKESDSGEVIFYTEGLTKESLQMEGVFVQNRRPEGLNWISAARGHRKLDDETGIRYLVLEDGYLYEGEPGRADFRVTSFSEYGVRMSTTGEELSYRKPVAQPTLTLWRSADPRFQAEFHWRIAYPLSALLFALLALPLSYAKPRQGRFTKLLVAIVVYLFYANLLIVGKSWLEHESLPMAVGLWWVHLAMVLLLIILWLRQGRHKFWRRTVA